MDLLNHIISRNFKQIQDFSQHTSTTSDINSNSVQSIERLPITSLQMDKFTKKFKLSMQDQQSRLDQHTKIDKLMKQDKIKWKDQHTKRDIECQMKRESPKLKRDSQTKREQSPKLKRDSQINFHTARDKMVEENYYVSSKQQYVTYAIFDGVIRKLENMIVSYMAECDDKLAELKMKLYSVTKESQIFKEDGNGSARKDLDSIPKLRKELIDFRSLVDQQLLMRNTQNEIQQNKIGILADRLQDNNSIFQQFEEQQALLSHSIGVLKDDFIDQQKMTINNKQDTQLIEKVNQTYLLVSQLDNDMFRILEQIKTQYQDSLVLERKISKLSYNLNHS